jgi:hypothetical protein
LGASAAIRAFVNTKNRPNVVILNRIKPVLFRSLRRG